MHPHLRALARSTVLDTELCPHAIVGGSTPKPLLLDSGAVNDHLVEGSIMLGSHEGLWQNRLSAAGLCGEYIIGWGPGCEGLPRKISLSSNSVVLRMDQQLLRCYWWGGLREIPVGNYYYCISIGPHSTLQPPR